MVAGASLESRPATGFGVGLGGAGYRLDPGPSHGASVDYFFVPKERLIRLQILVADTFPREFSGGVSVSPSYSF